MRHIVGAPQNCKHTPDKDHRITDIPGQRQCIFAICTSRPPLPSEQPVPRKPGPHESQKSLHQADDTPLSCRKRHPPRPFKHRPIYRVSITLKACCCKVAFTAAEVATLSGTFARDGVLLRAAVAAGYNGNAGLCRSYPSPGHNGAVRYTSKYIMDK